MTDTADRPGTDAAPPPPTRGRHRRRPEPSGLVRSWRAAASRISWGLADQAVSSLTNVAVGIVVARSLGIVDFGVFGLVWVTYAVIVNVSRGLVTDPLAVRFSAASRESWRAAAASTAGAAIVVGLAAGGICLVCGLLIGDALGSGFIALAVVLPALLLQDNWRFAFIVGGVTRKAFVNDVVWGVALVPALLMAGLSGTVWAYLLAWGASAGVAAAYGCVQARIVPRPGRTRAWLRQQRDLGPRYLVENTSSSGAAQIRLYGVGAVTGLADVGALRGSELLMGPVLSLLMGLINSTIPEAARVLHRAPHKLFRFCLALGVLQASGALVWGALLLFVLPDAAGEYLLGPIWPVAAALIVPATLSVMNASLQTAAAVGLRALGASRRSMAMQLIGSAFYAVFGILGAALAGAAGSVWGIVLATALSTCGWWWHLHAGLRDRLASPQPAA
ncbi:hypothetical protein [Pseudonocardia thermophila]|uniref:hypothetical protein n=1 Tax=Pseudonocardia thermophila TaxID=1848 RepID=UPI00248E2446|nr:hypothetical protein [Pseudonocardia thermophila]